MPYPTLLISESADEFEPIRAALEQEIQPRGIIEEKWVDDLANLVWQILRLQRCEVNIVNTAFHSALYNLLRQLGLDRGEYNSSSERAEALASAWFTEAAAKREVRQLLAEYRLDESAIEAEAMKRCLLELEQLERMKTSLDARYGKVLCMIATYRGSLGEQLRQRTDKVMERQNVLRLEDASSQKPTAA